MAEEITIDISPTGDVKVGAKGIAGPDCLKLTEAIEDALGEVTKRTKTGEFHQQPRVKRTVGA